MTQVFLVQSGAFTKTHFSGMINFDEKVDGLVQRPEPFIERFTQTGEVTVAWSQLMKKIVDP